MRKLLLVEDENILREAYEFILSTEPYDVLSASNGKIALDLCRLHEFDLILLDLMMPIMDGVEFLENLQSIERSETKIMVMSNLSAGEMLTKALKLGVYKNVIKADLTPKQLLMYVRYEIEVS